LPFGQDSSPLWGLEARSGKAAFGKGRSGKVSEGKAAFGKARSGKGREARGGKGAEQQTS